MYETDAIFNTNNLKLLLIILVSIDNINWTFLLTFVYIISETAETFIFVKNVFIKLFFYDNTLKSWVLADDFAKELAKTAADKEVKRLKQIAAEEEFESDEYVLQLCEWHEIEAIKQYLITAERYNKKQRLKIADLI